MREGWEIRKLGDIGTIIWGSTPKTNVPSYWGGDHYWITPAELDGAKFVGATARTITNEALKHTNLTLLPVGTVLLSSRAPIGKVAITTVPMYCNQGFKNIICGPDINNEFVYWFLIHSKDYLVSLGRGATFKEISKHIVEQVSIPIPPITEQEKIVAELDCLTGIIEKKKQQLEELDKLAQSIFYDMFGDPITNNKGWEMRLFKEGVIEMFLGPFGSSLKTDCYVEKERSYCMVYEQKHAIKKTLELDNHYIDEEKYNSLQRFEVRPGDLIMSCRGTIGEVYELPSNAPVGIIHPSLMKIRLRNGVFGRSFFKTILDKIVKGEDTNGGCVQMAITAKALGNKLVIHPPLDLQNEFAQKIGAIEKQKELVKRSIVETETLFNSRMDFWFN